MKHRDTEKKPLPYINTKDIAQKPRSQSSSANNRKEDFQVMKTDSRLPDYEPMSDKHLSSFLERNRIRRHLLKIGLIKQSGDGNASKLTEPNTSQLPAISRQVQQNLPIKRKEPLGAISSARAFLSKADFDQYLKEVRSRVVSVMEQSQSEHLQP